MANASFMIFVLCLLVGMAAFSVYAAWLHWTGSARAPGWVSTGSASSATVAGHERGIVPFAGWLVLLTAGVLTAVLSGSVVASALLFLASFVSLALHGTVVWFNWPRLLAPPGRRDETGTLVAWLRHRGELRAALKETAERDAPSHGSGVTPRQAGDDR